MSLGSFPDSAGASLIAEVAGNELRHVQLTYDHQGAGTQRLPHRQPAELLQTHGSGYRRKRRDARVHVSAGDDQVQRWWRKALCVIIILTNMCMCSTVYVRGGQQGACEELVTRRDNMSLPQDV